MKILIASALFPPDIADPAPYVKELTTRLNDRHDVSLVTYGAIPEEIPGVTITVIPKRYAAWRRIALFTFALWRGVRTHDVMFVHNAPSTELPLFLVGIFYKRKLRLILSDTKIEYTGWRKFIHTLASARVRDSITPRLPHRRPEILPFADLPARAFADYETSWNQHLSALAQYFT